MSFRELADLLRKLEKSPDDLDTLNALAVWYLVSQPKALAPFVEVHDLAMDDVRTMYELKREWDAGNTSRPYGSYTMAKAYGYFEKAYQLRKTVRSTNNFARFLFFDHEEEIERSLQIQQECLTLRPRSYIPHYQYGWMLSRLHRYGEAIPHLTAAFDKEPFVRLLHAIGVCHFGNDELDEAHECFAAIVEAGRDADGLSAFNLALTEYKLGNTEDARRITDELARTVQNSKELTIEDCALLYFVLDHHQRARECDDDCDLYSVYMTDRELWRARVHQAIAQERERMVRLSGEDGQQETEMQSRIDALELSLREGPVKREPDIVQCLRWHDCGCSLFGCPVHGIREDDWVHA